MNSRGSSALGNIIKMFVLIAILGLAVTAFYFRDHIVPPVEEAACSISDIFNTRYTTDMLLSKCGFAQNSLSEETVEFDGIYATKYIHRGKHETEYDNLTYYIFSNSYDAKCAFRYFRDTLMQPDTNVELNHAKFVNGYLKEKQNDLTVLEAVTYSGNLMITCELETYKTNNGMLDVASGRSGRESDAFIKKMCEFMQKDWK